MENIFKRQIEFQDIKITMFNRANKYIKWD